MTDTGLTPAPRDLDTIVGRLVDALAGAMDLYAVYLGDALGFYRALEDGSAVTPIELAERTGVIPRYAQEWCEAQAAGGWLECPNHEERPDARRFSLPPSVREVMLDRDSLAFLAPSVRCTVVAGRALPQLVDTYRGERTFGWEDHGPEMRHGQAEANRPIFRTLLVDDWLARMPDLAERLAAPGARVADVGCGMGWAAIALAEGLPHLRVDGYDIDAPSIEAARHHAQEHGVSDRVSFHVADIAELEKDPGYDAVLAFECLHDMSRPVEALASMRRIASGGEVLIVDERTLDAFTPDAPLMERLLYGYSLTVCLPDGMSASPSEATGTVMRRDRVEDYANRAGFSTVQTIELDHDQFRMYRLSA
jgi:ubiquinone/menaquinone biosynthesis C-methylase UbiE